MKIKFRQHLCILATMLLVASQSYAVNKEELQDIDSVHEQSSMTPEQLDESLRIDKHDLDLDNALHSAIDILEDDKDVQEFSPSQTTFDTHHEPSKIESSVTELSPKKHLRSNVEYTTPKPTHHARKMKAPGGYNNDDYIEFQFEDADLQNLTTQISELFDITFITDDAISPLTKGGKSIKGNKISFKTNKPLTRSQAWDLFITFLEIADLAVVPEAEPNMFRIMSIASARTSPIPSYLGVAPETLPDNDQIVRFLYFVENNTLDTIRKIVDALRSSASAFLVLQDMNAFVLTDKAQNIKSLMAIITELDRASMPQSMSVLKLKRADATEVKKLYDAVTVADDQSVTARLFPARKQPSALYFPENTRIIAEPRTNSLILLGAQEAIKKIENFIFQYIDVELGEESLSPLRVYPLRYADANVIANMMNDIVKFGKGSIAGNVGGVRDGDKYIKSLAFFPEPGTNRLVIKGDEEDYLQVKNIIEKLDVPQPQVAIEVLILKVSLLDQKNLGVQLRSKTSGGAANALLGNNVKFQTSGMALGTTSGIITNSVGAGVNRLLGNLMALVPGAPAGNTVVTFGSDANGVWGIFDVLQTVTNAQVVSNPFLTATNMQKALVSVGTVRRVVSGTVITAGAPATSQADSSALLTVEVKPQINSDGMIVLEVDVIFNDFTIPNDPTNGNKDTRQIKTSAIVADKEVLALGGLIRNTTNTTMSKTPILGDIPVLGWLFKNKQKFEDKENLLILISTRILPPEAPHEYAGMTKDRINDYYGTLDEMHTIAENRDPIHQLFFNDKKNDAEESIDNFIFEHKEQPPEGVITKKPKRARNQRKKSIDKERESLYKEKIIVDHTSTIKKAQPVVPPQQIVKNKPIQAPQAPPSTSKLFTAATPARNRNKQSLVDLLSDKQERIAA